MKGKSDFLFLGLLGAMIIGSFCVALFTNYVFVETNYAALFFLQAAFILRFLRPRIGRYLLGITLILSSFNIIHFLLYRISLNGIDPFTFPIAVAFYFANKEKINSMSVRLIRGSEKQQAQDYRKELDFYLKRFSLLSSNELAETMSHYDNHPPEAQAALRQLKAAAISADHSTENK